MNRVNFYCGKVNSQGGSKISLLNTLYLLAEQNKAISVYVSEEGWFTKELEKKKIEYTIISEPSLIKRINRETYVAITCLLFFLSLPVLFYNWYRIKKQILWNETIVFNESRDLILFFPFLFSKNIRKVQWIRSENIGRVSKYLLDKVNLIITVTDIVKENINQYTKTPIVRIHNFLYEEPVVLRKKIKAEFVSIAVIGSIQKIKGQLDAVKSIKHLSEKRNIKLYLIGREFDKKYVKKIHDYIKKSNMKQNVFFLGHIDEIIDFININIDIVLIPSQTESFCRVAMEAMSVGVPVVAYSVGGLTEVVEHNKTGFLVEKDNIHEMCNAVEEIINNEVLYKKLKNHSLIRWEKNFSKTVVYEELEKALYGGE